MRTLTMKPTFALLMLAPLGVALAAPPARFSIEDYLGQVTKSNGLYQSADLAKDAAAARKDTGDLVLAPILNATIGYLDDRKETQIPLLEGNRTKALTYTLGVSKQFSTGTKASLDLSSASATLYGMGQIPGFETPPNQNTETLTFSLSQSLWKDFFGRSTRLRHEREDKVYQLQNKSETLKARKVLVDAETAYWNYLYKVAEVDARKAALDRAKVIYQWHASRHANGLSNDSDILQAEALRTQREIQVDQSLDDLKAATESVRVAAHIDGAQQIWVDVQDLAKQRDLMTMVGAKGGDKVVRMDSELNQLDFETKSVASLETQESLRPDLNFDLKLASSGLDPTTSSAYSDVAKVNHPTLYTGLRFSLNLDQGLMGRARTAAAKDAEAANLIYQQGARESDSSWLELQRRYKELNRRIEVVTKLSEIQRRKSDSENRRMKNGRSTTFAVVQFEQDFADANLLLLQLESEARKIEAQAKMFKASTQKDEG